MDKEKNEAMVTKFSEKMAKIMLKKHRKFCRHGLTHLDATPIFEKLFKYLWDVAKPSAYRVKQAFSGSGDLNIGHFLQ